MRSLKKSPICYFTASLPNQTELTAYKSRLKGMRAMPDALKIVLENIPKNAHPMDVMRTGCSMLGNLETEASDFYRSA